MERERRLHLLPLSIATSLAAFASAGDLGCELPAVGGEAAAAGGDATATGTTTSALGFLCTPADPSAGVSCPSGFTPTFNGVTLRCFAFRQDTRDAACPPFTVYTVNASGADSCRVGIC